MGVSFLSVFPDEQSRGLGGVLIFQAVKTDVAVIQFSACIAALQTLSECAAEVGSDTVGEQGGEGAAVVLAPAAAAPLAQESVVTMMSADADGIHTTPCLSHQGGFDGLTVLNALAPIALLRFEGIPLQSLAGKVSAFAAEPAVPALGAGGNGAVFTAAGKAAAASVFFLQSLQTRPQ